MKRKPYRGKEAQEIEAPRMTLHESVPNVAFELAVFRMRYTQDSTSVILNDYLRELGA